MNLKLHIKKRKLERSFLRDRWGNLTKCYWNQMIKEEILKIEKLENEEKWKNYLYPMS